MLVFAHPDDETVALGARLARYQSSVIVHLTDGAPRDIAQCLEHGFSSPERYKACRSSELERALKMAGLENTHHIYLNIPDQQASFNLARLTDELYRLLILHTPEVVFTHPYEGGHPDHDACAFAVHRATGRIRSDGGDPPAIVEAPFYHLGPHGMETGCFLPHSEILDQIRRLLSRREQKSKQRLLACFASQQGILSHFPSEFESFRIAPCYNFHEPPHDGPVLYDAFPWGMNSEQFCELARTADAAEREALACRLPC
ncbi:MAG: PIG-L deacetylase family protein [Terracidiphilus sp.]